MVAARALAGLGGWIAMVDVFSLMSAGSQAGRLLPNAVSSDPDEAWPRLAKAVISNWADNNSLLVDDR
jgi:hypothetical protein